MKKSLIALALIFCLTTPSFSFSGYQYYDFGDESSIFDHNNNWAPIDYPGIGNLPSPGYYSPGGEYYDLEGLNVAVEQDFIYVSLTNSFGYMTNEGFRLGDLFIGVDGGDQYQYAVDLQGGGGNGGLWSVNGNMTSIQEGTRSYWDDPAISALVGSHEIDFASGSSASQLGGFSSVLSTWSYGDWESNPMAGIQTDTYVWELKIDRSLINGGSFSDLSFRVNLGCGNDLMTSNYAVTPEPATILLFGLGLVGGIYHRRRQRNSE